jgi:hypothetical protein
LEFTHIPIQFQGLDTKTDDKNALDGRFIVAENCVMQKSGRIESRYGYTKPYSTAFTGAVGAALAGSTPMCIMDGASSTAIGLLNPGTVQAGYPAFLGFDDTSLIGTATLTSFAFSASGDRCLMAWMVSTVLNLQLIDLVNKRVIKTTSQSGVTATSFKISGNGNTFACLYYRGGWKCSFSTSDSGGFAEDNVTGISAAAAGSTTHDICVDSGERIGVMAAVPADKVYFTYRIGGVWSSPTNSTAYAAAFQCVALTQDTTGWRMATANAADVRNGAISTVGVFGAVSTLTAPVAYTAYQIALGKTANEVAVSYAQVSGPSIIAELTVINSAAGWTTQYGSRIAARAYSGADTTYFTLVNTQEKNASLSAVQANIAGYSTYYVLRANGTYSFSYLHGTAWAKTSPSGTTPPTLIAMNECRFSSGEYIVTTRIRGVSPTGDLEPLNHEAIKITSKLPSMASFRGGIYTDAWGALTQLTPTALNTPILPVSMPFAPEPPTAITIAGALTGSYQYLAVYEITDAFGNKSYSTPSVPFTIALAAQGAQVSIYTPDLLPTTTNVSVAIYRTTANGTLFYKIKQFSLSSGAFVFNDTLTDALLVANEPLYTNGGSLESSGIAPSAGVFVAKGRLWSISAENRNEVYLSGLSAENQGVFFNDVLKIKLDELGGRLTAIAEMDEKVVLLKENAIYVTAGSGPDNDGISNAFPTPQLVTQSIGCKSSRSVVLTDNGLMFMSNEGIYLLSRGLEVVYLGASVEDFNSLTITSAMNLVDRHQVWFTSAEGTTLCWNEFHKQWTVFTGQDTNAALLLSTGVPTYVKASNGKVLTESKSAFTDDTVSFRMKFKTGWMTFSGIQGFQRFRKLQFSGVSPDTLTARVYHDFSPSLSETFTVVSATVGSPYQWEIRPARQKCEAFQLEIESADLTAKTSLSAFGIEAGAKKGTNRIAMSKRVQGV